MIFLMATMPVVRSIDTGLGVHQLAGHKAALAGDFWFPNPWKYRIFSVWLVEQTYQVYTKTVDKIIPIESLIKYVDVNNSKRFAVTANLQRFSQNGNEVSSTEYFVKNDKTGRSEWEIIKEFHRYFLVFMLLKIALNLITLWLAFYLYHIFVVNKWITFLGVILLDNGMNNAFRDTAFGFDTYIDLLLYILSAILIVKKYHPAWLIPVMIVGILNRETSLLIPALFGIVNFVRDNYKIKLNNVIYTLLLGLIGIAGFIGLRWYYGYEPYIVKSGWFRVVENFTNYSIISGQFAIMLVFPLMSILFLRKTDIMLKTIWLTLVPVWFLIHYWSFAVLEARYFLVPFSIAIIPVVLYGIEKSYINEQKPRII